MLVLTQQFFSVMVPDENIVTSQDLEMVSSFFVEVDGRRDECVLRHLQEQGSQDRFLEGK